MGVEDSCWAKWTVSTPRLFRIHMRPIGQLYSKASSVLRNRDFHVFEAARVGVPLIQEIVESAGEIDLFRNFAAENSEIHDEESAQHRLRDGPCPARILCIDAGKEFFLHERNTEIYFGQLSRRIGQIIAGKHVASVL